MFLMQVNLNVLIQTKFIYYLFNLFKTKQYCIYVEQSLMVIIIVCDLIEILLESCLTTQALGNFGFDSLNYDFVESRNEKTNLKKNR